VDETQKSRSKPIGWFVWSTNIRIIKSKINRLSIDSIVLWGWFEDDEPSA
jgi:hypothetical protein